MSNIQPGDKVIDKSNSINLGLTMNVTKVNGMIATVEYFSADRNGLHIVCEINIQSLEKVR